jgi:DtxR family Mn-dependent transcriptional regulator
MQFPQSDAELSRSTEDYLKAIQELARWSDRPIQTTAIADLLGVAPPSVSGMLRRLAEAGLLEHVPYKGVRLTDAGRRVALRVMRRHRILECYLTSRLGYDWDSVHVEAERLEHAVSDELIERMALVLGDPAYDPHGAPIPTRGGEIERPALTPLSDLPVGAWSEFRMVEDRDPEQLRYLSSLGMAVGMRFQVVDRQPFDGPVTIQAAHGAPVSLGAGLARSLGCAPAREGASDA